MEQPILGRVGIPFSMEANYLEVTFGFILECLSEYNFPQGYMQKAMWEKLWHYISVEP